MRIRSLHFQNFRSLRDVRMDDLGDLVVLIGPNSSGKSNVLDTLTLVFSELTNQGEYPIDNASDLLWFEQDTTQDITLALVLEISDADLEVLTDGLPIEVPIPDTGSSLRLEVEIIKRNDQAIFVVNILEINDVRFIDESIAVMSESSPVVLQRTSELLRGNFVYVSAARNQQARYQGFGERQEHIDAQAIAGLRALAESATASDVRVVGGNLSVKQHGSDMRYPLSAIGGGASGRNCHSPSRGNQGESHIWNRGTRGSSTS